MIKFKAGIYDRDITEVECVKETDKCVWTVNTWRKDGTPDRHLKMSGYDKYYDTWEEAHAYLLDNAERKVKSAVVNLRNANDKLLSVKGLMK